MCGLSVQIGKKHYHLQISMSMLEEIIPVFIEAIVFPHVGISYMIETKDQIEFAADKMFPR